MNSGANALPASIVEIPRKRSSFTSRSCNVLFILSTRPFACGELAQMMSMLSSVSARPNCVTPPARRALVVDAEDAMPVAVEGHRLAVALKIGAGRGEVVECRFAPHEAQPQQPPGGVVDVDQY